MLPENTFVGVQAHQANGQGDRLAVGQDQGKEEFVPALNKPEHRAGHHSGHDQRQGDMTQNLETVAAVDHGSRFDVFRQGVNKTFDHPDGKGQDKGEVENNQGDPGVQQVQGSKKGKEREHHDHRGHKLGTQHGHHQRVLGPELIAAEGIAGAGGCRNSYGDGEYAHHNAVEQQRPKIVRVLEDGDKIVQGWRKDYFS